MQAVLRTPPGSEIGELQTSCVLVNFCKAFHSVSEEHLYNPLILEETRRYVSRPKERFDITVLCGVHIPQIKDSHR